MQPITPRSSRPRSRSVLWRFIWGGLAVSAAVGAGALAALLAPSPMRDAAAPTGVAASKSKVNPPAVRSPTGAQSLAARALTARVNELSAENQRMADELAAVSEELTARKSEVSFSYGSVRESGAFVGRTLRLRLEIANTPELQADEAQRLDNQLDVLSLGPFIREADLLEGDPAVFAQFQSALIGEMLGVDAPRRTAIANILLRRKTELLEREDDVQAWLELNEQTADEVGTLFSSNERETMANRFTFLREHGMLMIPAYSVLEE